MCEKAAEAHKSKGTAHSSRRSRMSSESSQISKSSVDALLSNSNSPSTSQVSVLLFSFPSNNRLFSWQIKILGTNSLESCFFTSQLAC